MWPRISRHWRRIATDHSMQPRPESATGSAFPLSLSYMGYCYAGTIDRQVFVRFVYYFRRCYGIAAVVLYAVEQVVAATPQLIIVLFCKYIDTVLIRLQSCATASTSTYVHYSHYSYTKGMRYSVTLQNCDHVLKGRTQTTIVGSWFTGFFGLRCAAQHMMCLPETFTW